MLSLVSSFWRCLLFQSNLLLRLKIKQRRFTAIIKNFWRKFVKPGQDQGVPVSALGKMFISMGENLSPDEIDHIFNQYDKVRPFSSFLVNAHCALSSFNQAWNRSMFHVLPLSRSSFLLSDLYLHRQDGNGVVDLNEFIMGTVQYLWDQSHRSDIKHEAELAKHHAIGGSLDKVRYGATVLLLCKEKAHSKYNKNN